MKLHVTGVETLEVTDPSGLSDLPQVTNFPPPQRTGIPAQPAVKPWDIFDDMMKRQPNIPQPMIPTPISPTTIPNHPFTTGTGHPSKWERKLGDPPAFQPNFTGDPPDALIDAEDGQLWARGLTAAYKAGGTSKGEVKETNGNGDNTHYFQS